MSSKVISYGRHSINKKDLKSVLKTLKSDFITQGPEVKKFEYNVKKKVGVSYALAVNSATSALHLSCVALGITNNDIVWISANGFVATSNCALYCGAKINFIDVDKHTGNISLKILKKKLEKTKKKNIPKVLITVHFGGQPTQQDEIFKLSRKYGFKILEDASHSLGAKYKNQKSGNCKWSDIAVFSFHPVKIITTGEGGMCLTNNQKYFKKINILRTHGINRNITPKLLRKNPWLYKQVLLGFNYRMSDIHASLGNSQIKRLDKFIQKRKLIAKRYDKFFNKIKSFEPLTIINKANSSYHLYVVKLKNTILRRNFFIFMKKNKVNLNIHYVSIDNHPFYKDLNIKKVDISNWIEISNKMISLPIFFDLTTVEQKKIFLLINKFIKQNNL